MSADRKFALAVGAGVLLFHLAWNVLDAIDIIDLRERVCELEGSSCLP